MSLTLSDLRTFSVSGVQIQDTTLGEYLFPDNFSILFHKNVIRNEALAVSSGE
jgi:hypothetical protein